MVEGPTDSASQPGPFSPQPVTAITDMSSSAAAPVTTTGHLNGREVTNLTYELRPMKLENYKSMLSKTGCGPIAIASKIATKVIRFFSWITFQGWNNNNTVFDHLSKNVASLRLTLQYRGNATVNAQFSNNLLSKIEDMKNICLHMIDKTTSGDQKNEAGGFLKLLNTVETDLKAATTKTVPASPQPYTAPPSSPSTTANALGTESPDYEKKSADNKGSPPPSDAAATASVNQETGVTDAVKNETEDTLDNWTDSADDAAWDDEDKLEDAEENFSAATTTPSAPSHSAIPAAKPKEADAVEKMAEDAKTSQKKAVEKYHAFLENDALKLKNKDNKTFEELLKKTEFSSWSVWRAGGYVSDYDKFKELSAKPEPSWRDLHKVCGIISRTLGIESIDHPAYEEFSKFQALSNSLPEEP